MGRSKQKINHEGKRRMKTRGQQHVYRRFRIEKSLAEYVQDMAVKPDLYRTKFDTDGETQIGVEVCSNCGHRIRSQENCDNTYVGGSACVYIMLTLRNIIHFKGP
jgi:hypothetical protein